jgi:hypothetical protein
MHVTPLLPEQIAMAVDAEAITREALEPGERLL